MNDEEAVDPDDGIDFAMVASLHRSRVSAESGSDVESVWSSMYRALFPKDHDLPSPCMCSISSSTLPRVS